MKQDERECKTQEPPERCLALQNDRADLVSDRGKGQPGRDNRRGRMMNGSQVLWFVCHSVYSDRLNDSEKSLKPENLKVRKGGLPPLWVECHSIRAAAGHPSQHRESVS